MRRSSSGISPVVATVILVAIAIVIAIAVAFWASGLVGIFTRFEKLEITAAYVDPDGNVILRVKNSGSAIAVIDDIYVNGVPLNGTGHDCVNATLTPGQVVVCTVESGNFPAGGVTDEFAIHTTSGKLYPTAVLVP